MNILVTGGAGFIGSSMCKRLIGLQHNVICIDNLITGNLNNINDLLKQNNFIFENGDIQNKICYKVDRIYNLACPASPYQYQKNPVNTLNVITRGVYSCIENAIKNGTRILHASTSEIYGNPLQHPQAESYWGNVNPIGPRACYNEAKRFAETILINYNLQYKIDIRIARIFNTYGPNMQIDDGRVVSNFIVQALKNEDITVYGDGQQTRSFCYCDDLIDGLIELMEYPNYFGPINLGNSQEVEIIKLSENIIRLTKSRSKIIFKPLPIEDPIRRKPDITFAKEKLCWEPKIELEEGLIRTIEYFRRQLSL